jgi:acetolactate synthase regulatory subunit
MSITAAASSETPLASPLRRYELMTTGGSEALMRVIGLVRRRGGELVSLDFRGGNVALRATTGCSAGAEHPGAGQSSLELAVAIDRRRGATLALRLAGLIDVVAVREY